MEIKKSKHFSFWFLLGFHDTVFEKIKAGHPAQRQSISLPAHRHPRLTAKKKGSIEIPTPCTVSTWQSPGLVQGTKPGWACQEMYHFHMQRHYLALLYIPSSFPRVSVEAPTDRQLLLHQNERHGTPSQDSYSCVCHWCPPAWAVRWQQASTSPDWNRCTSTRLVCTCSGEVMFPNTTFTHVKQRQIGISWQLIQHPEAAGLPQMTPCQKIACIHQEKAFGNLMATDWEYSAISAYHPWDALKNGWHTKAVTYYVLMSPPATHFKYACGIDNFHQQLLSTAVLQKQSLVSKFSKEGSTLQKF